MPAVASQAGELRRLVPNRPEDVNLEKISAIGGATASAFLDSNTALGVQLSRYGASFERLEEAYTAVEAALSTGSVSDGEDLGRALEAYSLAVKELLTDDWGPAMSDVEMLDPDEPPSLGLPTGISRGPAGSVAADA